jgi:protease-4
MKRHPILLGLMVFAVLLGLLMISLWAFSFFASRGGDFWSGEKVAIIEVKGVIVDAQPTIEKLIQFRKNRNVKAIIVRVDSPGGGVGPAQEIYSEIKKAQREKKILVSVGSVAASGGYYIACAADKILANPGSITGSIGVIMESVNVEDLLHKVGVQSVIVKSGKHKDIGSPFRAMTEEEKKLLQSVLDNVHDQFIRAVAEGRNLPVAEVRQLADGRIFSGEQAKDLGLVDELGTLQDTIALAAKMSGIQGEPEVIYPEKSRFSLLDFLFQGTFRNFFASMRNLSSPQYFLYYWPGP